MSRNGIVLTFGWVTRGGKRAKRTGWRQMAGATIAINTDVHKVIDCSTGFVNYCKILSRERGCNMLSSLGE